MNLRDLFRRRPPDPPGEASCWLLLRQGDNQIRIPTATIHRVTGEVAMLMAKDAASRTQTRYFVHELDDLCGCRTGALRIKPDGKVVRP